MLLRGEGCCAVGRASRDSAGFGAMEEGLISRRSPAPALDPSHALGDPALRGLGRVGVGVVVPT